MLLNIVTPNKKLLINQEVTEVVVPAFKGELTIYDGHSPLITTLEIGVLKYKATDSDQYKEFAISWGYCEIAGSKIQILAEKAESAEEIDKERSEKSLQFAEAQLNDFKNLEIKDLDKYTGKMKRAIVRLSIKK